jgi:hypothetical protein
MCISHKINSLNTDLGGAIAPLPPLKYAHAQPIHIGSNNTSVLIIININKK